MAKANVRRIPDMRNHGRRKLPKVRKIDGKQKHDLIDRLRTQFRASKLGQLVAHN